MEQRNSNLLSIVKVKKNRLRTRSFAFADKITDTYSVLLLQLRRTGTNAFTLVPCHALSLYKGINWKFSNGKGIEGMDATVDRSRGLKQCLAMRYVPSVLNEQQHRLRASFCSSKYCTEPLIGHSCFHFEFDIVDHRTLDVPKRQIQTNKVPDHGVL